MYVWQRLQGVAAADEGTPQWHYSKRPARMQDGVLGIDSVLSCVGEYEAQRQAHYVLWYVLLCAHHGCCASCPHYGDKHKMQPNLGIEPILLEVGRGKRAEATCPTVSAGPLQSTPK